MQGMSVRHYDQVGKDARNHWRVDFGIPLAREGNAVDYAQTVMGIVTVCWRSWRTRTRTLRSRTNG